MRYFQIVKGQTLKHSKTIHLKAQRNATIGETELLPFGPGDATAGTENELQAVVIGKKSAVDLPVTIDRSRYYANIARRVATGEASNQLVKELERFLADNRDHVWENSWVRFLSPVWCIHVSYFRSSIQA